MPSGLVGPPDLPRHVLQVAQLREKPTALEARRLIAGDALWILISTDDALRSWYGIGWVGYVILAMALYRLRRLVQ